jgi:hypothetical protein
MLSDDEMRVLQFGRIRGGRPRAAAPDDELMAFLDSFSADTECVHLISPAAFVAELHRRWSSEQQNAALPPAEAAADAVPHRAASSVSYSRVTDATRAQRLVKVLENLGAAPSEIWLDRKPSNPGSRSSARSSTKSAPAATFCHCCRPKSANSRLSYGKRPMSACSA